jgi:protein gp37
MSQDTDIAYVHSTWNGYRGCTLTKKCEVRTRCWAAALSRMWGWNFESPHTLWGKDVWSKPREWDEEARLAKKFRLVFAGDLGDVFQDHLVVNRIRPRIWDTIRNTPNILYYVSTKVPENAAKFLPDDWGEGYPNVWLAVTVTSPKTLWRMDALRKIPAALRAVSAEPLWGPMDDINLDEFGWLIVGGESGPQWELSRMQLQWARDLWEKASGLDVPYFFKQVSSRTDQRGIDALDRAVFGKVGKIIRTRQWPATPRPLLEMREKGHRFTDEEWQQYKTSQAQD